MFAMGNISTKTIKFQPEFLILGIWHDCIIIDRISHIIQFDMQTARTACVHRHIDCGHICKEICNAIMIEIKVHGMIRTRQARQNKTNVQEFLHISPCQNHLSKM